MLAATIPVGDTVAASNNIVPQIVSDYHVTVFPRLRKDTSTPDWIMVNHHVIWHGRRRCHARRPACGACPLVRLCPAYGEGPTDPKVAEKLIREPRG